MEDVIAFILLYRESPDSLDPINLPPTYTEIEPAPVAY